MAEGKSPHPRVLIRTRPLRYGNYGGILQAYALQSVLRDLGFSPVTDESTGSGEASGMSGRAKSVIRSALTRIDLPGLSRPHWVAQSIKQERDAVLDVFIDRHIDATHLYRPDGEVDRSVVQGADAFVVGSDQVWRGAYGRVESYLLDFLDDDDTRPRVAYAASFGTDHLNEFTPEQIERTGALARRFDMLSVREDSGVSLCAQHWGADATHVPDPTILVEPAAYRSLAAAVVHSGRSTVASYVLDPSPSTESLTKSVSRHYAAPVAQMLPATPSTVRQYRADPDRYSRPSVEEWIAQIDAASCLVTDSFHGTVFAILLNKPFISVRNGARGAARFESLLGRYGLRNHLLTSGQVDLRQTLTAPIDWDRINGLLAEDRAAGRRYLEVALSGTRR